MQTNQPIEAPIVSETSSIDVNTSYLEDTDLPKRFNKSTKILLGIAAAMFIAIITLVVVLVTSQNDNNAQEQNNENESIEVSITQSPVVTDTVEPTESVVTTAPKVTTAPTSNVVSFSNFSYELMPWAYSFKYPNTWKYHKNFETSDSVAIVFEPKTLTASDSIKSMVFALNIPAEFVDNSLSTQLSSETVILERDGEVELETYKRKSDGETFLIVNYSKGYLTVDVANGKTDAATDLFKQIIASFYYDEAGSAR